MSRALYMIGEPGVGKTTALTTLCSDMTSLGETRLRGQLWAESLRSACGCSVQLLGRSRGVFSGTDALGMGVNPDATRWALEDPLADIVLGEGSRLANRQFLFSLFSRAQSVLVYLTAEDALHRRIARGSEQDERWIRGRVTASKRLFEATVAAGFAAVVIDSTALTPTEVANHLRAMIGLG